MNCVRFV